MTEISPAINVCLKERNAPPIVHREYDLQKINSFLQEAYSIVGIIQA